MSSLKSSTNGETSDYPKKVSMLDPSKNRMAKSSPNTASSTEAGVVRRVGRKLERPLNKAQRAKYRKCRVTKRPEENEAELSSNKNDIDNGQEATLNQVRAQDAAERTTPMEGGDDISTNVDMELDFMVAAPSEIGKALVVARNKAGKTQTDVAEAMGTSQGNVARLEKGGRTPTLSTLLEYAGAIGRKIELRFTPD